MLQQIKSELEPHGTSLVAVSKTRTSDEILGMYHKGQRIFGENRVQELVQKYEELPKDIEWHMIGHLQRNKVKYIAPFVTLIHAVDSIRLLEEINKQGAAHERIIPCLLQYKIAEEESKFGMGDSSFDNCPFDEFENVKIAGVMGMATFTSDSEQVRREFKKLKNIFNRLKENIFQDKSEFSEISMGMSGDYRIAIEEGSTMVRIGSLLFGNRI